VNNSVIPNNFTDHVIASRSWAKQSPFKRVNLAKKLHQLAADCFRRENTAFATTSAKLFFVQAFIDQYKNLRNLPNPRNLHQGFELG
jgi:hypothetical protein